MECYYHSDIITKVQAAFTCKIANPEEGYAMAESLTAHRLANPIEGDQAPATQVARTLYGCLCNDEKNLINVCPYKPEDLNNEEIKNLLLKSCSEGNFIPFMVNFYRDDVEPEDANNLLIVVAGVGENPDENFIVMTIWLQKVQDEMGMVFSNENGEELTQMIYPLVFSVPAKAISSVLDAPAMHARMFVLQESTEKEEATDADKQTEAPVELEEVQQSV